MPKRLSLVDATAKRREEFVRAPAEDSQQWRGELMPEIDREPARKKTTFNLDAQLHQRLKLVAVRHKREMVDIVEEALFGHLRQLEATPGE